jgi:hypothetical protein
MAVVLASSASAAPSGLDVWLTCQQDIKTVCPGTGLMHMTALKACMKENLGEMSERCQTVVKGYQAARQAAAQAPSTSDRLPSE